MRPRHAVSSAALAIAAATAAAGPLTPPAGAPSSTDKPLAEVEPRIALNAQNTPGDANSVFKITALGSYYLTDRLDVPQGFAGIEVTQACTIDLNGFTIQRDGPIISGAAIRIDTNDNATVRIQNGAVRLIPAGIEDAGISDRVTVDHVTFTTIDDNAIVLDSLASISNCAFDNVGGAAVRVGPNSLGADLRARNCGSVTQAALDFGQVANVRDLAIDNAAGVGLQLGSRSVLTRATVRGSGGVGIDIASAGVMRDCVIADGAADGVMASQGVQMLDCVLLGNAGFGLVSVLADPTLPSFSVVAGCHFIANLTGGIDGVDVGMMHIRDSQFIALTPSTHITLQAENRIERCHFASGADSIINAAKNTIIDCSFMDCDLVLNANNNFVSRNTFGGSANLIDNTAGSFAPTPTSTPTSAWDNIEQ